MNSYKILTTILAGSILMLSGCNKQLEEQVYSQLAPENFLITEDGIKSVIYAAYTEEADVQGQKATKGMILSQEMVTDMMWETAGADNRQALQFINFTWDASLDWLMTMMWAPMYRAIRDANSVLDNLNNAQLSDTKKSMYDAEARFIRAISYYHLYVLFGPVPLRTTTESDVLDLARSTDDEMKAFIETELTAATKNLADPGKEPEYGRANKGAAMAFLCKFYLNTKQWQKCADIAKQIIDLNYYQLFTGYPALFRVENERNKEYMWVRPCVPSAVSGPGNDWEAYVFPIGFQKDPATGLVYLANWRNYAAQYRMRDAFFNTFSPSDKRRSLIMTSYINTAGQTLSLLNNDDIRPLKYWPDPAAIDGGGGNDLPEIRYADIILSRAEALNELNGPNAESISLINLVRKRAELADVKLTDFTSKDALRDHIVKERGWEFYSEGLRREDLVRTGKYIPYAKARGVSNAKDYHILFPIPQQALDADPLLKQNAGY